MGSYGHQGARERRFTTGTFGEERVRLRTNTHTHKHTRTHSHTHARTHAHTHARTRRHIHRHRHTRTANFCSPVALVDLMAVQSNKAFDVGWVWNPWMILRFVLTKASDLHHHHGLVVWAKRARDRIHAGGLAWAHQKDALTGRDYGLAAGLLHDRCWRGARQHLFRLLQFRSVA